MPDTEPQDIETLKRRYDLLQRKQTQADTLLQQATAELEKLKAEARAKYGTDDVGELQARLQEMERDNVQKRREYQALLDSIEAELKQVESRYAEEGERE